MRELFRSGCRCGLLVLVGAQLSRSGQGVCQGQASGPANDGGAEIREAFSRVLTEGSDLLLGFPNNRTTLKIWMLDLQCVHVHYSCKGQRTCLTTLPRKPPILAPQGLEEKAV